MGESTEAPPKFLNQFRKTIMTTYRYQNHVLRAISFDAHFHTVFSILYSLGPFQASHTNKFSVSMIQRDRGICTSDACFW